MGTYPPRDEAEALVREAERCNPGPWGDHSRIAAMCAEKIAQNVVWTGKRPMCWGCSMTLAGKDIYEIVK